MRILVVTPYLPYENAPQAGQNFTFNFIKLLKENLSYDVDLLSYINDDKEYGKKSSIVKLTNQQYFIETNKFKKISNILLSPMIPIIAAVRYDRRVLSLLRKVLLENKYDKIILDYTQMSYYYYFIKNTLPNIKIELIEQDVSFLSFERKYKNELNPIKKILYYLEYVRLYKYENNIVKKYDTVFTVNKKDADLFLHQDNIKVLSPYYKSYNIELQHHDGFNIMFWGAMNRKENQDAVKYFVEKIWPNVDENNTKLFIIGSNPSEDIKAYACKNVEITGFIDEPSDYFSKMDISVVPLRYGAGIKIKVLESMSAGIPVVTTTIGAEGIQLENETDCFITDNQTEFSERINMLKKNEKLFKSMSLEAKKTIESKYNFNKNVELLRSYYKE